MHHFRAGDLDALLVCHFVHNGGGRKIPTWESAQLENANIENQGEGKGIKGEIARTPLEPAGRLRKGASTRTISHADLLLHSHLPS